MSTWIPDRRQVCRSHLERDLRRHSEGSASRRPSASKASSSPTASFAHGAPTSMSTTTANSPRPRSRRSKPSYSGCSKPPRPRAHAPAGPDASRTTCSRCDPRAGPSSPSRASSQPTTRPSAPSPARSSTETSPTPPPANTANASPNAPNPPPPAAGQAAHDSRTYANASPPTTAATPSPHSPKPKTRRPNGYTSGEPSASMSIAGGDSRSGKRTGLLTSCSCELPHGPGGPLEIEKLAPRWPSTHSRRRRARRLT